ncbi:MAG: hypothetical protein ISEC1_P1961 [Thiomicrorhabdus sp.]|nr:MAG: hypothetical protein ISEC1_P1961 [Thiomicrorhabdus sp.]
MLPSFKLKPPISAFSIGEQSLPVVRTRRKNSIALKQRSDGVVILVPSNFSNRRLMNLLNSHHDWLKQALSCFEQRQLKKPALTLFKGEEGELFDYFGKAYSLSIQPSHSSESWVLIENQHCYIHLAEQRKVDQTQQVKNLIENFIKQQAQSHLLAKLNAYAEQIGVQFKSLTVKGYKSRWGSCYADGRIQFNWRLLQAPEWVIDYVVVHELCHLVHANHSKAFWDLVCSHYPETPKAKAYIRQHGQQWIQFLQ